MHTVNSTQGATYASMISSNHLHSSTHLSVSTLACRQQEGMCRITITNCCELVQANLRRA